LSARRWRVLRWLLALLLCLPPVPATLRYVPPAFDPWAPLDLAAAPNLLTPFKLGRLERDPASCLRIVASSFPRVPDRPSATGCPIQDAVRVTGASVRLSPGGFVATCPLAAAWVLFEREVLQPAARAHLGQEVRAVRHLGSFACRNVYGRAEGRRSQHATANAVDLAGFVLADGKEIRVLRDWPREGAPQAAFLRAVHTGACRFFDVVLGPSYNAAHRDHFHLDMGRWRACR
jgi:hypothetical protein